jgi:hypothetical protein
MTKKVVHAAQERPAQATQGKASSRKDKQHKKQQQQEQQPEQQGQEQPHGHPYGVQPWGNFYLTGVPEIRTAGGQLSGAAHLGLSALQGHQKAAPLLC